MTDLLRWPIAGPLLRWRRLRTLAQIVLLLVAAAIVAHGLFGPDLAPTNLATVLTWIHYRGLLVGALMVAGNAFCSACPMILVRDLGRRLHPPARHWPRWLPGKWVAVGLFVLVLFTYERFDLWALPAATAWLVVGYFLAALLVDTCFRGAAFCKHVCPVGQFSFIGSTLSPLELHVRDRATCRQCTTADCIKGRRAPANPQRIVQRGCELGLFLPTKVGNLDCTFCLDCVQACPHDNIAIGARVPGEELVDDQRRSAIGRLSRRADLAALALIFTFSALLNAWAMTGPVYGAQVWLSRVLGTTSETVLLGIVFAVALGVLPVVLCGAAAGATRLLGRSTLSLKDVAIRYAYSLVPLGLGMWLAHYGFHFLTGVGTVVPVGQGAVLDLVGRALLGEPNWGWIGMRPGAVFPIQVGFVLLGATGSLVLVRAVSERDHAASAARASLPWHALVVVLGVLALWILAQPMEMRGTGLGG